MGTYTDRAEKKAAAKSRRTAKGIFAAVVIVLLGALGFWLYTAKDEAAADKMFTFETNSERVRFLNRQGLIVQPEPESQKVTIPAEFNEQYTEYNSLQKEQGLDLEPYKGKEVTLYVYSVLNYPDYPENVTANLLFDDHRLIGADISYNDAENGFTKKLITNTSDLSNRSSDITGSSPAETSAPSETTVSESTVTS